MKKTLMIILFLTIAILLFATDKHDETTLFEDFVEPSFCVVYLAEMLPSGAGMIVRQYRIKKDGRTCSQIEQMLDEHFSN